MDLVLRSSGCGCCTVECAESIIHREQLCLSDSLASCPLSLFPVHNMTSPTADLGLTCRQCACIKLSAAADVEFDDSD